MRIRVFLSELRLYICNHIVNKIPLISLRMWFYRYIMGFKIGKESYIFMGSTFDATQGLMMGNYSVINAGCRIDTRAKVEIGNNVSVSNNTIVLTADHDMNSENFKGRTFGVIIKDYVWIGTSAMIMPGVTIEEKAVVAAGSIVTKNVSAFAVVAGIPAKKIKERADVDYEYKCNYKRLFQ